jgi:seryl-tRNA synthetase
MFHDAEEDHWFVPTAEVPLTLMHLDEILDDEALPLKYTAHSSCFRREKVAHGRDVRGIKRVFQFEKVELYQFTKPEDSPAALEAMLLEAETLLQELELTYRVLQISSGDLGFTATVQYDLEVWAPGAQEWLEVGSTSNCTDFQARRTNTRYRPLDDEGKPGRPQFVHTLNGSGLALPRVIAAILENYQRENGSVAIPDVLQHRMGRLLQITV